MRTDRLARRVLRSPALRERGVLVRETPGYRNMYGEWVPGSTVRTDVVLTSSPVSGEERLTLAEGLRTAELRQFVLRGTVRVFADGADGDVIEHGGESFRAIKAREWEGGFTAVIGHAPIEVAA